MVHLHFTHGRRAGRYVCVPCGNGMSVIPHTCIGFAFARLAFPYFVRTHAGGRKTIVFYFKIIAPTEGNVKHLRQRKEDVKKEKTAFFRRENAPGVQKVSRTGARPVSGI